MNFEGLPGYRLNSENVSPNAVKWNDVSPGLWAGNFMAGPVKTDCRKFAY